LQDISLQSVIDRAGKGYSLYSVDIGCLTYWGFHEFGNLNNIDIIMII